MWDWVVAEFVSLGYWEHLFQVRRGASSHMPVLKGDLARRALPWKVEAGLLMQCLAKGRASYPKARDGQGLLSTAIDFTMCGLYGHCGNKGKEY